MRRSVNTFISMASVSLVAITKITYFIILKIQFRVASDCRISRAAPKASATTAISFPTVARTYHKHLPQNYKFEGKERDKETGNDYSGARLFFSTYGRFLSPDWSAILLPSHTRISKSAESHSLCDREERSRIVQRSDGHRGPSYDACGLGGDDADNSAGHRWAVNATKNDCK